MTWLCFFHESCLTAGAVSRSGKGVVASEGAEVLLGLPASVGAAKGLPVSCMGQGKDGSMDLVRRESVGGRPQSLRLCASLASLELRGCQGEGPPWEPHLHPRSAFWLRGEVSETPHPGEPPAWGK